MSSNKSAPTRAKEQPAATRASRLANDPLVRARQLGHTAQVRAAAPRPVEIDRNHMSQTIFAPRAASPRIRVMRPTPRVSFTQKALDKMGAYVGLMSQEIAWMSTVERVGPSQFVITDCHLFGQAVHATTAEIDPEKLGELVHEILRENPADGINIVNSLKAWGHSHVNMGTSPSGQDDRQMDDFAQTVGDYMIRVIANKKGDIRVCLWDYESGLIYEDLPWTHADAANLDRLNMVADEIEQKVTKLGLSGGGTRRTYNGLDPVDDAGDDSLFYDLTGAGRDGVVYDDDWTDGPAEGVDFVIDEDGKLVSPDGEPLSAEIKAQLIEDAQGGLEESDFATAEEIAAARLDDGSYVPARSRRRVGV